MELRGKMPTSSPVSHFVLFLSQRGYQKMVTVTTIWRCEAGWHLLQELLYLYLYLHIIHYSIFMKLITRNIRYCLLPLILFILYQFHFILVYKSYYVVYQLYIRIDGGV